MMRIKVVDSTEQRTANPGDTVGVQQHCLNARAKEIHQFKPYCQATKKKSPRSKQLKWTHWRLVIEL